MIDISWTYEYPYTREEPLYLSHILYDDHIGPFGLSPSILNTFASMCMNSDARPPPRSVRTSIFWPDTLRNTIAVYNSGIVLLVWLFPNCSRLNIIFFVDRV